MSGVICERISGRVKGKVYKLVVSYDVWFGNGGTNKKTGGGVGGGRADDAKIFI